MMVMTPVKAQTSSSQPLEPTSRAMSAETINMPEPIMVPATSMVASKRPRRCWKPFFAEEGSPSEAVLILGLVSIQRHARRGNAMRGDFAPQFLAKMAMMATVQEINAQTDSQPTEKTCPVLPPKVNHHQKTENDAARCHKLYYRRPEGTTQIRIR